MISLREALACAAEAPDQQIKLTVKIEDVEMEFEIRLLVARCGEEFERYNNPVGIYEG